MPLSNDEIAAIADWEPIRSGFGRDERQTGARIRAVVDRINSNPQLTCKMLKDDGLSNYFVLFASVRNTFPSYALSCNVDGLLIYLSACGPIAVAGRSRHCVAPDFVSWGHLDIDMLISPDEMCGDLELAVLEAIRSSGYELLSPAEVAKPIPRGVKPLDWCFSSEPWDCVFHALFGDTD